MLSPDAQRPPGRAATTVPSPASEDTADRSDDHRRPADVVADDYSAVKLAEHLAHAAQASPPRRIQFTRADRLKGRTMADVAGTDAVRWVGRPSKYGNPHPVESVTHMCGICGVGHDQADAVAEYARYLLADAERIVRARVELAGLTLACACPVGTPCHADLLVNIVDARSDAAAAVVVIVAARPAIGGDDV